MKAILLSLCFFLLPIVLLAQFGKNRKYKTINVATTFNYYPALAPYSWASSYWSKDPQLVLTYRTHNTGSFEIVEGDSVQVNRSVTSNMPSQLVQVGASVQIINENSVFQELSLTKLSIAKSSHVDEYFVQDSLGNSIRALTLGYEQSTAAFGLRYEIGKYFGNPKRAKLRFGISTAIEPSFYSNKLTPFTFLSHPIRANFLTVDVALIPMLNAKISKQLSVDFKVIPNILLADVGYVRQDNPIIPEEAQGGERDYGLPEINVAFGLFLRYKLQEPKRRKRQRSGS